MEQNPNVAADTTSVASVVKGIVDIVLAKLNITERGKIENFFMKQRSELNKEIRDLTKNKKTLIDDHQDELEDLDEKLADALVEINEAYSAVTIENISSNEKAKAFSDTYWANIEEAEQRVESIKDLITDSKEDFQDEIEEIDAQIDERQRRLNKIS